MIRSQQNILDVLREDAHRDSVLNVWNNFKKIFDWCIKDDNFEPFGTVAHGDLWTNNVLFQYEEGVSNEGPLRYYIAI